MQYVQFKKDAKFDLIAMGRIAIDFNPIDYFKTLAESKEYRKYLGGSPANVAVGLARLGKKVGFVARVSDDRFGDYVTDFFAKEGIDVSHVKRAEHGEKLGLTFTEILSPTESSILMYRDGIADLSLDPSDVDEEYIASAKALLISGTALAQSPSREACLKAMQFAEKNDVRIIFDIDYRPYNWKSADEIAVYYTAVAEHADIIMGSREEYDLTQAISLPGADDVATAAHWFAHRAKIVIITLVKIGYFFLMFWACLQLMQVVVADIELFGFEWTYPVLYAVGFALFCLYDPLFRWVYRCMITLISRHVKTPPNQPRADAAQPQKTQDVFDETDSGRGEEEGEKPDAPTGGGSNGGDA